MLGAQYMRPPQPCPASYDRWGRGKSVASALSESDGLAQSVSDTGAKPLFVHLRPIPLKNPAKPSQT